MSGAYRVLVFLSAFIISECMERSSMYMKKAGSEDMETSGTGYNYQVHSGAPFTYPSFNTDTKFDNFKYPPRGYRHFKYTKLPLHSFPLSSSYVPHHYDRIVNSYGMPVIYAAYVEPVKGYEAFIHPFKSGISGRGNYGLNSGNFVKSGGSSFEDVEKAVHGEKGERGYLNREEYGKGSKGEKENEQHKGYYNLAGGKKAGYLEAGGHYANKAQGSKGNSGASFSGSKGHKKDSKTTGYHNVYHKDDYKKDHSFYDKADRRGHFKKYGDYDSKEGAQQGAFEKGDNHDKGFKGAAYGVKGYSDKGQFVDEDKGYKGAAGDDKYYQNSAEYADKGGKTYGKEKGFRESDKYKDGLEK